MRDKAFSLLKKLSGHDFVRLTSRGNTAIYDAFYFCKKLSERKKVLFPDQGGWFTYKKYPKELEMEGVKLKTDYGVIDLDELKKESKDANCLIYSSPAGYYAEQPVKEIYDICKKNGCLVILDVTGSIGAKDYSRYCDFSVCSFGEWKPVNLGYGGFISSRKDFPEKEDIFSETSFDESYIPGLVDKLKALKQRYELFEKANRKIKKDLGDLDVLHKDRWGINVIVKFNNDEEKQKIIDYCKKNRFEFTLCPRYIRVKAKAISIEVKRLE